MKKPEIAREWARQSGVSPAEAADRVDRVVSQIVEQLRKGGVAPLPGLGRLRRGSGGRTTFEPEQGKQP